MFEYKIVYDIKIYKFQSLDFFEEVFFSLQLKKILLKIENSSS